MQNVWLQEYVTKVFSKTTLPTHEKHQNDILRGDMRMDVSPYLIYQANIIRPFQ